MIHEALEDLEEALCLVDQVLVPDYLDTLHGPDWDLLITLRNCKAQLAITERRVADHNRAKIQGAWVGGSTPSAPLGLVEPLPPEPEG